MPERVESAGTAVPTRVGLLTIAGLASVGAGALHAAAIGVHAEHSSAVLAFALCAAFQLIWGVVALLRHGRLLAVVGALGNGAIVAGWVLAKTFGIWFIDGLDQAEPVQLADGLAGAFGVLAVVGALAALVTHRDRVVPRAVAAVAVVATGVLLVPGMVSAGSHHHEGSDHAGGSAAGHDHGTAAVSGAATAPTAVIPPTPYDPARPIDLSGVDGVTPAQQARAENLIAATLSDLAAYADVADAEAAGYRTIGDGFLGHEHYFNWSYINDGRLLDSDYPESLVYQVIDGRKTLVAAMYMLPDGTTLADVPDVGGPLTQWHVHQDICFAGDPEAPVVAAVVQPGQECPPPMELRADQPMLHVWITPNPCGPFAALEGIGGGQVVPGEERLCDHVHGTS